MAACLVAQGELSILGSLNLMTSGVEINRVVYTFRILDADKFGGFRRLLRMPQDTEKTYDSW